MGRILTELADRYPGIVYVSASCYGSSGPWARRGGFDMNGSAVSGLGTIEGSVAEPRFPVTFLYERLHHRLHGSHRCHGCAGQAGSPRAHGRSTSISTKQRHAGCGSLGFASTRRTPAVTREHSLRAPRPLRRSQPPGRGPHGGPAGAASDTPPAGPSPHPARPEDSSWLSGAPDSPTTVPTSRPKEGAGQADRSPPLPPRQTHVRRGRSLVILWRTRNRGRSCASVRLTPLRKGTYHERPGGHPRTKAAARQIC